MSKGEKQEQEFLAVCSRYDYELLTGKKPMTLLDYERITHITVSLGLMEYTQLLIGRYLDLALADEERMGRGWNIYLDYPEYFDDEETFEKQEQWVKDFINQIPKGKKKHLKKLLALE